MNILVAFNKKYMFPTMAMLHSVIVHTTEEVIVYVLQSELSEEDKDCFRAFLETLNRAAAVFIDIPPSEFENCPTEEWITKETYYRLLAQKMLPEEVDRILWLDSDLIILDDLSGLYHTDLKGNLIAACDMDFQRIPNYKEILKSITLPTDAVYFNAGVVLFDMKEIRKKIDPDVYMQYVKYLGKRLLLADQDVLNAVFYKMVYYLDPSEYDYVRLYEPLNRRTDTDGFSRIKIIHYNGKRKPWNPDYNGLLAHHFWKHAKCVPNWDLDENEIRKQQKNSRRRFIKRHKRI